MYRPENEEILRSPEYMMGDLSRLGYIEGDCDDIAIFVATVFRVLGVPVRFVALRIKDNDPEFGHVFTELWTGNGWYALDPTVKPGTRYRYAERMIQHV